MADFSSSLCCQNNSQKVNIGVNWFLRQKAVLSTARTSLSSNESIFPILPTNRRFNLSATALRFHLP